MLPDGRGKLNKDKKMVDAKGTIRYVPYGKWRNEIIKNPHGVTAQRAKAEGDPDLDKIQVEVLRVGRWEERAEKQSLPIPRAKVTRVTDLTGTNLTPEEAKRMGFRPAEAGKTSMQKVKEKDEEKKEGS
jgi:hypothetical protein